MAPITRSHTRTRLVGDVFTTPGISTIIASQLEEGDPALLSMFGLFNDARYREELEPFVRTMKTTQLRETMARTIHNKLNKYQSARGVKRKTEKMWAVYEYLCEMEPHLPSLERKFGRAVSDNLAKCIRDAIDTYQDEFVTRLEGYRTKLSAYIAWAHEDDVSA